MKKIYRIVNQCSEDSSVELFELKEKEAEFLETIFQKMNNDSLDSYAPTLSIEQVNLKGIGWRRFDDRYFAKDWIETFGMGTEKICELNGKFYVRSNWE